MKKIILSFILSIVVLASGTTFTYAAGNIVESPGAKIDINGTIGTYSNVPINSNGRILLPLRAIMVNLGVPNDDSHIIWNPSDRTATIIKDSNRIVLKIDSSTASVNGNNIALDAAAVIYKDRTYVPVRFVSQSFGMKVAWDPDAHIAYIRDTNEFNQVKDILSNAINAMNSADKYKTSENIHLAINSNGQNFTFDTNTVSQTDNKNKTGYAVLDRIQNIVGKTDSVKVEIAAANNNLYYKDPTTGQWQKDTKDQNEYNNLFVYDSIDTSDVNCAGLKIDNTANPDEIILKGNVPLKSILGNYYKTEQIDQYSFNNVYTEISINKATNQVDRIYLNVDGTTSSIQGGAGFTTEITTTNTDFNGSFNVNVPDNLPN